MFGKVRSQKDQERSRRNERNIKQTLFIGILVSQWIDSYRELKHEK